jgi:hypothetical protein
MDLSCENDMEREGERMPSRNRAGFRANITTTQDFSPAAAFQM